MRMMDLSGWGRSPRARCRVIDAPSRDVLRETLVEPMQPDFIARGLGRSYGDSSLNDTGAVLTLSRFNRFLAFHESTGELHCEAGVSLADIMAEFLPRGWFLPVTPGTKHVTVGGAIAADVHGKNHHVVGSFGNFVKGIELLLASGEIIEATPTRSPDVFWATVGGMGLTGIILSARIELRRVPSAFVEMHVIRTRDLDESLRVFAETDREYRYSVAWIDCLARGRALGRSVIMLGNDAAVERLPKRYQSLPLRAPKRLRLSVPMDAPGWLLGRSNVRAFNAVYYASHPDGQRIIDYNAFFYPLDHISDWNRLYGRRGFLQYQALFPRDKSGQGLRALLENVARGGRSSFLAVLKSTGPASQGMLSYAFPGHTLALDIPLAGEDGLALTRELDELVLSYGGRLYLAKDATTTACAFAAMYPSLETFRVVKQRLDPERRFVSRQATRVGIV